MTESELEVNRQDVQQNEVSKMCLCHSLFGNRSGVHNELDRAISRKTCASHVFIERSPQPMRDFGDPMERRMQIPAAPGVRMRSLACTGLQAGTGRDRSIIWVAVIMSRSLRSSVPANR